MATLAQHPKLTTLEWSTVAIALNDASRCGCAPAADASSARLSRRIATAIFGRSNRPNGLADPRLEAIRQFVCATSRHRKPAAELAPGLAAQGFNQAQIDAIALLSI